MERKFYTDDFERLLKERSDEFRMYPSKRVWHSIYNDLHPGRKWPSIAVSLLLIAALFITGYWNSNNNKLISGSSIAAAAKIANSSSTAVASANNSNGPQSSLSNTGIGNDLPMSNYTAPTNASGKNIVTVTAITKNDVTMANTGIVSSKQKNVFSTTAKNTHRLSNVNNYNANSSIELTAKNNIGNKNKTQDISVVVVAEVAASLAEIFNAGKNSTSDADNINSDVVTTDINSTPETVSIGNTEAAASITTNENKVEAEKTTAGSTKNSAAKTLSTTDKAWVDDYAFYNRSNRKKWKDRLAKEFYITPSIGFRKFSNNSPFDPTASAAFTTAVSNSAINAAVNQKPGMGMEAGLGLVYSLSKNIRIKAGVQANYTSYTIMAEETNHPILTTLRLTDINTGYPYMAPRTATLSNSSGLNTAKAHNKTYQISIPVGLAYKLAGNDKLEWYAGASLQPTFVFGGKANLISDDRKNYVSDASLMRRWSLNSGFETYINYKFNGVTLQVGPQFRYQLLSTYSNQYTLNENLYNAGLKIGILKNF